jgi:hypothetical protein
MFVCVGVGVGVGADLGVVQRDVEEERQGREHSLMVFALSRCFCVHSLPTRTDHENLVIPRIESAPASASSPTYVDDGTFPPTTWRWQTTQTPSIIRRGNAPLVLAMAPSHTGLVLLRIYDTPPAPSVIPPLLKPRCKNSSNTRLHRGPAILDLLVEIGGASMWESSCGRAISGGLS